MKGNTSSGAVYIRSLMASYGLSLQVFGEEAHKPGWVKRDAVAQWRND